MNIRVIWNKKNLKCAGLAVALVALALLAELGFVVLTDGAGGEQTELPAASFSYWEMEPRENDVYYMLAYNSYFESGTLDGGPIDTIDVALTRSAGDTTTSVVRFTGVKNGVAGEFVTPLTRVSDGRFTAAIEAERVDSIKIYPTELVRTEIIFGGLLTNPAAMPNRYSPARALMWGYILASLYCLYILIRSRIAKTDIKPLRWRFLYVFGGALALLTVFMATRMFTAARGMETLLLPAGITGFTVFWLAVWMLVKKIKTAEGKLCMAVAAIGLMFAFASAPLQAPDEYTHFLRAYAIAQGDLVFDYNHTYPDDVYHLVKQFPGEFYNEVHLRGDGTALSRMATYFAVADTPYTGARNYTAIQVVIPYIPAAVGIALVRLLGGNALFALYAARLCNVALLAFCAWYGLRRARRYRGAFIATALFPLTLFIGASTSYDSMMLACLLVFLGLIFGEKLGWRELSLLAITFLVMISIKPIYLPLALLVFLIPREEIKVKIKGFALLPVLLAAGWIAYQLTLAYASRFNIGIPSQIPLEGVDVGAQAMYVLRNPLRYLMVMLVDGYQNSFYLTQLGRFGWLDVTATLTNLLTPILLVVVAALYADTLKKPKRGDMPVMAIVTALTYAVIVTGFYCTWSSLGSTSILGVQARYFIPFLPAVIALLTRAFAPVLSLRAERTSANRDVLSVYLCAAVALLGAGELALNYFLM